MKSYIRCFLTGICIWLFAFSVFAKENGEAEYAGSTQVQAYVVMETETVKDDIDQSDVSTDDRRDPAVKTGDDAPLMLWITMLIGTGCLFWTARHLDT